MIDLSKMKRGIWCFLGLALVVLAFQVQFVQIAAWVSYLGVGAQLKMDGNPSQYVHLWGSTCWLLIDAFLVVCLSALLSRQKGRGSWVFLAWVVVAFPVILYLLYFGFNAKEAVELAFTSGVRPIVAVDQHDPTFLWQSLGLGTGLAIGLNLKRLRH